MSTDIGPKRTKDASSNDLLQNHKKDLESEIEKNDKIIKKKVNDIQKQVIAANKAEDDRMVRFSPEHIEIYLTLSENVYQVARLICQFEYDLDWDAYVSELVKEDAFSITSGDRQIFQDYVERMLKDEQRYSDY